jgi:RNA-directed DNA polymerase
MRREFHVRFCESPRVQFPRATRLVICFEREQDSEWVWKVLGARFAEFGLTLHPGKTRRFSFRPPRDGDDKGGATFDFLGFTSHWTTTKRGMQRVAFRTRGARLRRAIKAVYEWCRRHRHDPIKEQHLALTRKLKGHYSYYGVNGNMPALQQLRYRVTRAWRTWLDRRSQRARMKWKRFNELLRRFPLPAPRIAVQIWRPRQLSLRFPP